MKRWLAIPVAAILAVAAGAVSWQGGSNDTEAGGGTALTLSISCVAPSIAPCTYASGTGAIDVNVVLTNNSGGSIQLGAFGFDLTASNATTLVPVVPGSCGAAGTNCNPDFNEADVTGPFACSPPAPVPDNDASGGTANSSIGCFTGGPGGVSVANGGSLVLGSVHYTETGDGVHALALDIGALASNVYDENFGELGTCPEISVPATCNGITLQVGASASTATPTITPTNTAVPTDTPLPCVGAACPTATSLAYKTVTPTGTITVAGSQTPVPGAPTTAPPPPPPTGQPGGTTGSGGSSPIRLPDTGSGGGNSAVTPPLVVSLATVAIAAVLAGGLGLNIAAARRRED